MIKDITEKDYEEFVGGTYVEYKEYRKDYNFNIQNLCLSSRLGTNDHSRFLDYLKNLLQGKSNYKTFNFNFDRVNMNLYDDKGKIVIESYTNRYHKELKEYETYLYDNLNLYNTTKLDKYFYNFFKPLSEYKTKKIVNTNEDEIKTLEESLLIVCKHFPNASTNYQLQTIIDTLKFLLNEENDDNTNSSN
jgi:hypothetical protein